MKNRHYPLKECDFIKIIEPHIIKYDKRPGRPASISHYQFFSAVLYVLRTGIPWRDVPDLYGHWHTIYMRFKDGVKMACSGTCFIVYNKKRKSKWTVHG
ncbi:hypothetical protein CJJ19_02635 [Candidatus Williamhamiltonella defendens]|nr:transposase [Candidatus Hamiltonella defensa]AYB48568.1 hypothetical protein CJJ19_02635 [Candidatus Hamiltonella defensa]